MKPARSDLVYYVSPFGRDTWSGLKPDPARDGSDGPFATVARARDAVRALKARRGGLRGPVTVLIRGGTYELPETLRFGPEDSGTSAAPITYAAYPGEHPVLSGGRRVTGWTVGDHKGLPCWTARLPEVGAGRWYFTQLFVNEARRPRTRKPRTGLLRFADLPKPPPERFVGITSAQYAPGDIDPHWRNLTDVKIVALQHWFDSHLHIASVEDATRTVHFQAPSISHLRDEKALPARYYLENIFEELSVPGQWYLDRKDGTLYYLPLPGETPENTVVVAPRLKMLLWVDGARADGPVRHLRFENLSFHHAEWMLPRNNPGPVQAGASIPAAVVFGGSEDCVLFGCRVAHVSQYAIEIRIGCQRTRIIACHLHDLGAGGVKINSESPLEPQSITGTGPFAGMEEELEGYRPLPWIGELIPGRDVAPGMHTEIADCTIHDAGLIHHSAVGVWIGNSGYNHVHHNEIFNLTYTAISSGWTWSYSPSYAIANRIEYNHLHHIGQELLSDMGGIYTLGLQPGSTIKGNVIHDVTAYGYGGWGIYLDQGSSYLRIEDNLVYRTKHGGFHQHFGRDNLVRNNIFAFSASDEIALSRAEAVRAFILERNLVYETTGQPVAGAWRQPNARVDHNLYWRTNGSSLFAGQSFTAWQAEGFDRHGCVADPLFEAPEIGRFALRADSPALRLGFSPLDPTEAGPRPRGLRAARVADLPPLAIHRRPIPQCRFELGPPTQPRADRDIDRMRTEPLRVPAKPGKPVEITFSVTNYGQALARGQVRLAVSPAGAGKLRGGTTLRYTLKPGAQAALTFTALLNPRHRHMLIEARPSDPTVFPSALQLTLDRRPTWRMAILPGSLTIDRVAPALASLAPLRVRARGAVFAEVRLACAGDYLALLADVRDARPEAGAPPWEGSCVELFGSRCGTESISQLVLVPETGRSPGGVWQLHGGLRQVSTAVVRTHHNAGGYRITALIPADLLALDTAAKRWLLEIKVTTATSDGQWVKAQAFEAVLPHASNWGYAEVLLRDTRATANKSKGRKHAH